MNGSHIAIPTILKVGKGTLKDIGSYIKDSRIENAVVYFGNGLVDMFGDTVLQSFQKENINVLEYKELDSIKIEDIIYEVKNKLYKILRHQQSNNITKNIKFNFFEKS